ncbi:MAG TPA: aldo/keto reductase [Acetobacteraceae bacterium]|nr:aldo/keto reductase [Acetobacteraceae bacterium]
MRSVPLGPRGPLVPAIGLGCMAISGLYGPADDAESVKTIHAALESGVSLLDTGDFYGMGHNELLLRRALEGGKRAQMAHLDSENPALMSVSP